MISEKSLKFNNNNNSKFLLLLLCNSNNNNLLLECGFPKETTQVSKFNKDLVTVVVSSVVVVVAIILNNLLRFPCLKDLLLLADSSHLSCLNS